MAKKKPQKTEEIPEISQDDITEVPEEKAKPKKKQYWNSPVYIRGIGTVKGEVDPKHLSVFKSLVPKATNVDKYLVDYDPEAKKLADAKRRMRAKIGLHD